MDQTPPTTNPKREHWVSTILNHEAPIHHLQQPLAQIAKSMVALGMGSSSFEAGLHSSMNKVNTRRLELEALPDQALEALYGQRLAEKARKAEASRFYNQAGAVANFKHWLSMDFWTLEEAVALLTGRDPRIVNRASIDEDIAPKKGLLAGQPNPPTPFTKFFAALLSQAEHANAMTHSSKLTPVEVIQWAKGILGNRVPAPLIEHLNAEGAAIGTQPVHIAIGEAESTPKGEISGKLMRTQVKRAALIAMADIWSTVVSDFQHCKANGLDAAAKAPGHGMWWKEAALEWAANRGKLNKSPSAAALPHQVFRIN